MSPAMQKQRRRAATTSSDHFQAVRARCARLLGAVLVAGWLILGFAEAGPAEAHRGACDRIQVETRDRGVLISEYFVGEPGYVSRMHALIDQHGQDDSWTVAAGDLGVLGYTVTYTCLL